jgi:hypothetical protein
MGQDNGNGPPNDLGIRSILERPVGGIWHGITGCEDIFSPSTLKIYAKTERRPAHKKSTLDNRAAFADDIRRTI